MNCIRYDRQYHNKLECFIYLFYLALIMVHSDTGSYSWREETEKINRSKYLYLTGYEISLGAGIFPLGGEWGAGHFLNCNCGNDYTALQLFKNVIKFYTVKNFGGYCSINI